MLRVALGNALLSVIPNRRWNTARSTSNARDARTIVTRAPTRRRAAAIRSAITLFYPIATLCAALSVSSIAFADSIRVLNWQGYGTDEPWALETFTERTGVEVIHDYFSSEQEMLTKLRTNPGVYDVVLINSAYTRQAAEEGLIEPIDTTAISHFADLSPAMARHANLVYEDAVYGIAWVWGVTSFAIDRDKFPTPPTSIEVLWDPKYAGRVGWRDDAVEAVQLAAIALGQDMNAPSDFDAIGEKLRALKPQIRTFWTSENEWNQFLAAGEFDLATYWSGSASRAKTHFQLPVEFIIPKEGAIGWLDGLSIPTDSGQRQHALAFIDWMIDPEYYVKWDTDVGAPASANAKANAQLPDDAFNKVVLGDAEKLETLQFMSPIADDVRKQMLELWQETKTLMQQ